MGVVANLTLGSGEHIYTTTIGAVSPKSVLTNLSSKFDRFLAVRSQFNTGHRVDFYAHVANPCSLDRLLHSIVLCFLREKKNNNVAIHHRCGF